MLARGDVMGEEPYRAFRQLDIADFISVEGRLFRTRTGEIVQVSSCSLLSKALRPLPEKWHGLKDVETRYRQRYRICYPTKKYGVSLSCARIVSASAGSDERGFLEVETPILQPLYGGEAAVVYHTTTR